MTTTPTTRSATHLPPTVAPTYRTDTNTNTDAPPPQPNRHLRRDGRTTLSTTHTRRPHPTATTHTMPQQTHRHYKDRGFCNAARRATRVGHLPRVDVPAAFWWGLFWVGRLLRSLGALRAEIGRIRWVPVGGTCRKAPGRNCWISASKWCLFSPANYFGGWF